MCPAVYKAQCWAVQARSQKSRWGLHESNVASVCQVPYLRFIVRPLLLTCISSRSLFPFCPPEVGVKVFIIDSASAKNTEEVVQHIRRVAGYVASENSTEQRTGPLGFQRCLFYQDDQGRLFNLMLSRYSVGPAGTWLEYLESFSGAQAMVALTVLCRSLPCLTNGSYSRKFKCCFG